MASKEEKRSVEEELEQLRNVASGYSASDIRDGSWFAKFLYYIMETYSQEVDADFFKRKYPGLPADAIVDRRIDLAKKYAAIEGAVSSSAYSGLLALTVGSGGGSSPATVPAALTAFAADMMYLTKLQLNLAYDISVLYGCPVNMRDPEDLYSLFRVAFGVKAGEVFREALPKAGPEVVRQVVKKVASGSVLKWMQALPIIGKYLLQRNLIKFAIPLVNIPLSTGINYISTSGIAKIARQTFRDKAHVRERARQLAGTAGDAALLCAVLYAVARADGEVVAEEGWLLRDVVGELRQTDENDEALKEFENLIQLDEAKLFAEAGNLDADQRRLLYDAGTVAATVDHKLHRKEKDFLKKLADVCGVDFDEKELARMAKMGVV